jgi:hypothetical protein
MMLLALIHRNAVLRLMLGGLAVASIGCSPTETTREPSGDVSLAQQSEAPPRAADSGNEADEWQGELKRLASGQSDTLYLVQQSIGDQHIAQLQGVVEPSALRAVMLDEGKVTDAGLKVLARSPLTHLRLRYSPITDQALRELASAPQFAPLRENLSILNLPQAELSAEGMASLQAFPLLSQLRLGGGQIDDDAVAELAKLPNLRSLHLIAPRLTARGLDHLASAPRLNSFYLDQCQLEDAAWLKLFEAKPNLHVHIDQAHHDRDPKWHPH